MDSLVYKTDRPWPNTRLKTAAIVGHTTTTSSRIWLRTGSLGDFTLVVYPIASDPRERFFGRLKRVPFALDAIPAGGQTFQFNVAGYSDDTTHVVDVTGLAPATEYAYALWGSDPGGGRPVDRVLLGQDRHYTFRTLRLGNGPLTFAFFSCHMPYEVSLFGRTHIVNMKTWEALHAALSRHVEDDLQFIIAAGDQVYADGVDTLSLWKLLRKRMRKSGGELFPSHDDVVSWYRDIYRGYWGFSPLQEVYSCCPTYMIWDDHEIGDGWGSFKSRELSSLIPTKRGWSTADRRALLARMFDAARQVYGEYQHSHNPPTAPGVYDYGFLVGSTAIYVLDGRGQRDINRSRYNILGESQFRRFSSWLDALDPRKTKYLFVVSAVPLLHLSALASSLGSLVKSLRDDLRDSWDHELHNQGRKAFMAQLFNATARGIRVAVLSGDVHTAAAFRIVDEKSKGVIYQLTSSAITYNVPRVSGWLLAHGAKGRGHTHEGYAFERVALYPETNFGMVRVDPDAKRVEFRLYGQKVAADEGESPQLPTHSLIRGKDVNLVPELAPGAHSIATIPLIF